MGQFSLFHRGRSNGAEIRIACGRSDGQRPGVLFIPRTEQVDGMFHYGIHPFAALIPDPFGYDRNQFHLDFFAVVAVQVQEGRIRGFAYETEHVDAEVIKNQGRPSHGGDIKTVPTGRDTGEYKPV